MICVICVICTICMICVICMIQQGDQRGVVVPPDKVSHGPVSITYPPGTRGRKVFPTVRLSECLCVLVALSFTVGGSFLVSNIVSKVPIYRYIEFRYIAILKYRTFDI